MIRVHHRQRSTTMLLAAAVLVGHACGEPSQPAASASPSRQPQGPTSTTGGPFEPMTYPPDERAPCDQAESPDGSQGRYAGSLARIRALDARTVVFELCDPDVALPTRLALAGFAVNDTGWLLSRIDPAQGGDQAIARDVNGTGPYRLDAWTRGSEITLVRNAAYWGEAALTEQLIVRWRDGASARLAELQAGTVDGIDDTDPSDVVTIERDPALQPVARSGLNTFYVGFNNTFAPFDNPSVRQAIAMGIDRARIVERFYPPGSEVASHFAPCSIKYGCEGEAWYEFDAIAARQLLADAGYPDGFKTKIQYREVVRPYLHDPTAVATELQNQLLTTLNIRAELQVLPDDSFLAIVDGGDADGIHLLGRSASVPEVSHLLDPHFGSGASREFGETIGTVVNSLAEGAATPEGDARGDAYRRANDSIRTHVPMIPVAHAGSMTAYRADVNGALSSPLRYERLAAMKPGDRQQFVWLTGAEPDGLYCADETSAAAELVCAQFSEGLYAFDPGRASVSPALADACEPNPELTIWTCSLRPGVSFHDGAALDANDVVLSFAAQWDAEHPLHRGREGRFQPFVDAFGGHLNPPG